MPLNFKPEEEEKFQPYNRWYNVHIRDFCIHAIFLYHLTGIWYFCKNLDFYRTRFEQAGFPLGGVLALLIPAVSFISLFCIWERNHSLMVQLYIQFLCTVKNITFMR